MHVLITGAAGFIGSHLCERLAQKGHAVTGIVRDGASASPSSAARVSRLASKIKICQVRDFSGFGELEIPAFDACVHLAGRSSVRESLQNPGLYADANCRAAIELLKFLRARDCRRVVHASTVMIYGKDAPLPYNESQIGTAPASFYGASKLSSEVFVNTWRHLACLETINLRFFSVYGPNLRPDCVPALIASAIREQREFNVFGDGSSVRDYVEIEDVLDAVETSITVPWKVDFPEAINVGSGVGTALIDLIGMIEGALGQKARVCFKPAVAGELGAVTAQIDRARCSLGWTPRVRIKDGIERFAEWFRGTF